MHTNYASTAVLSTGTALVILFSIIPSPVAAIIVINEPVCLCCSGQVSQPEEGPGLTLEQCQQGCQLKNGFKSFGIPGQESIATGPECPGGAAPPPAGAEGAPAAPQAPVKYEQGAVITEIENPLGTTSIPELIGRVINAALGISGSIAILMVVYGGITWLTSGGSPEKIEKGKKILVWATIGLAVIFGAYSLVNFVISRVIGL